MAFIKAASRRGLLLACVMLALAPAAGARDLFTAPTLSPAPFGMDPPRVVRTVPPATMAPLDANQCQLMAGTCPLGRLQRSGTRCFCAGPGGVSRQGTTRTRPQDIRPPVGQ